MSIPQNDQISYVQQLPGLDAVTATETRTPVEALAELPDDEFLEVVKLESRNELGEPWATAIRAPENAPRWLRTLAGESQSIQGQLTQRAADLLALQQDCLGRGEDGRAEYFAAKTEHDHWRGRAVGAKRHIDARLAFVKALVKQQNVAHTTAYHRTASEISTWKGALRQIAHYPLDSDPEGLGNASRVVAFFQDVARRALGEEGS